MSDTIRKYRQNRSEHGTFGDCIRRRPTICGGVQLMVRSEYAEVSNEQIGYLIEILETAP